MAPRKGASRRSDISRDVLQALNAGTLESATLAEGLAVDFAALLRHAAPDLRGEAASLVRPADGISMRMRVVGELLATHHGLAGLRRFAAHRSDTVRGWAAFLVAALPGLSLDDRLRHVRPLADDPHFGVREWAWLALRDAIAGDLTRAIELLMPWVLDASANVRRFASESTRPRGVWCSHIAALKERPELGLPLLEPLRSDPSRYVQDSVGNWLNDAAKSRPDWVRQLCARWREESRTPQTSRVCGRASRSL
jgi:3-methyladenine DNA glycosylase AlkC